MVERFLRFSFQRFLNQGLRDLCSVPYALCKMQCLATYALYIMCTFQHMHFALNAFCNFCSLKHVHSSTCALCNTCTLQLMIFATAGRTNCTDQIFIFEAMASLLIQRLTVQFVHCCSFRVRRRPCLIPVLLLWGNVATEKKGGGKWNGKWWGL